MLPRKNRLTKKEFDYVFSKSKNFKSLKYFDVRINLYNDFFSSKFACVVSKKNEKTAIKRNLVKRKFYEVIRINLNKIKKQSNNFIFIIRKDCINADFKDIENQFLVFLKENNLIL